MEPFRPVLVIFAGPSSIPEYGLRVSADVQIWRGDACVTTVPVLDLIRMDWPQDFDPSCVEQMAAITSRIVARLIDEKLYERLKDGRAHTWGDIAVKYPLATGAKE